MERMDSTRCPEQEERAWIQNLASDLAGRKLTVPAIVLLEMCRPVAFIGSQLLLLLDPLVSPWGATFARRYASLLQDPQQLDTLLKLLENQRHDPAA